MSTLLVGFDSAWTPTNSGAIVGVLLRDDGTFQELGLPLTVDYHEAERGVLGWQAKHSPASSIVLIDQPTIVKNAAGQRPVEHIVGSPVSLRYGRMQPANTAKDEMFGAGAPIWSFLSRFGGPADPIGIVGAKIDDAYGWLISKRSSSQPHSKRGARRRICTGTTNSASPHDSISCSAELGDCKS